MADILVHNTTDEDVNFWWGNDLYVFPAGSVIPCPRKVALDCFKHKDYKMLEAVDPAKKEGKKEKKVPTVQPWDTEDWDPMTAPLGEIQQYFTVHNLIWNDDDDEARDIVYEHLISK